MRQKIGTGRKEGVQLRVWLTKEEKARFDKARGSISQADFLIMLLDSQEKAKQAPHTPP